MKLLKRYFGLNYEPVGVRVLNREEENYSRKLKFCEAVKLAASGEKIVLTKKNLDCFGAELALGFVEPVFEGITKAVIVEPYSGEADAVLLVANAEVIMKISQIYHQIFGEKMAASFSGEKAVCGEGTATPILSEKPNISFLCQGARNYGAYTPDEMVIGFPSEIFKIISAHVQKKQIKSMCGCLTDDIPEYLVKKIEDLGFYKATDHFAGVFDGRIVKLHVYKGEDSLIGIFTSLKFGSEDEARRVEEAQVPQDFYLQRRENWIDVSKIVDFEEALSKNEFQKLLKKEISSLLEYSKTLKQS